MMKATLWALAATIVGTATAYSAAPGSVTDGYERFDCGVNGTHGSPHFHETVTRLHAQQKRYDGSADKAGPRRARSLRRRASQQRIVVPTYFHVLQSPGKQGTVTRKMARAQAAALNRAYQPAGFTFDLRGTTFSTDAAWAVGEREAADAAKRALRRGGYGALNIYFHTDFTGGNLGTCTLPAELPPGATAANFFTDGCNVNAGTMPGGSDGLMGFDLGGTGVHETGHWLGLLHTFEGYSCEGEGDFIDDTPAQSVSTNGCPGPKPAQDSCPTKPGVDPIHNYMDYSIDKCYEAFTPLQVARMVSMWDQYRRGK